MNIFARLHVFPTLIAFATWHGRMSLDNIFLGHLQVKLVYVRIATCSFKDLVCKLVDPAHNAPLRGLFFSIVLWVFICKNNLFKIEHGYWKVLFCAAWWKYLKSGVRLPDARCCLLERCRRTVTLRRRLRRHWHEAQRFGADALTQSWVYSTVSASS